MSASPGSTRVAAEWACAERPTRCPGGRVAPGALFRDGLARRSGPPGSQRASQPRLGPLVPGADPGRRGSSHRNARSASIPMKRWSGRSGCPGGPLSSRKVPPPDQLSWGRPFQMGGPRIPCPPSVRARKRCAPDRSGRLSGPMPPSGKGAGADLVPDVLGVRSHSRPIPRTRTVMKRHNLMTRPGDRRPMRTAHGDA